MSLAQTLLNFLSFVSGTLFGILIALGGTLYLLSRPKSGVNNDGLMDKITACSDHDQVNLSKEDEFMLNKIIDYLDEVNSPLKNMGGVLQRIHMNKELDANALEAKMKTIIDIGTLNRTEKDFQDNVAELKDHGKQIRTLTNYIVDVGKTFNSFAKELGKISHTARSNMNKNLALEKKEDMIVNNWWQALQVALDHLASDLEDFATCIAEEVPGFSTQMQEELSIIEKRLLSEGSKQFNLVREHLSIFETKLKERDRNKEKLRLTNTTADRTKRMSKYKVAEANLVTHTKRLYDVQKEFYSLTRRISSDVQLTILKSVVETQGQLVKFADGLDRMQTHNRNVCMRMKMQLTNAASSLVQMIREENVLLLSDSSSSTYSFALEIMNQRLAEARQRHLTHIDCRLGNVAGFELTLQKVLEGLIIQPRQQLDAADTPTLVVRREKSHSVSSLTPEHLPSPRMQERCQVESQGKLDMFQEATANLAASNPMILPLLPKTFQQAIGVETCVWFNAFSGRVYRDMANSPQFYKWFCHKLALMLNRGDRPAYVDQFQVVGIQFGKLPPLLFNVKWSPPTRKKREIRPQTSFTSTYTAKSEMMGEEHNEDVPDANSEESDTEEIEPGKNSPLAGVADKKNITLDNDVYYYAACTADMAFRSGIKFIVSTQLFLNWPRDRYVSVPVTLEVELSEMCGRIRFGVTRSYSFITFLRDPMTRIGVRSEVGNEKYKLKDIPQISDFIVRKLKNFIHRRIVHPHSHKFRLIWPRNWWPEGTEDQFMPFNDEEQSQSCDVGSAKATSPAADSTVQTQIPVHAANHIPTTASVPMSSALKFEEVHRLPEQSDENVSGGSGVATSSKGGSSSMTAKLSSWLQGSKPSSTNESTKKKELKPQPSAVEDLRLQRSSSNEEEMTNYDTVVRKADRWQIMLRRAYRISSRVLSLDEVSRRTRLLIFFDDWHKVHHLRCLPLDGASFISSPPVTDDEVIGRDTNGKLLRRISISDFRSQTLLAVFEQQFAELPSQSDSPTIMWNKISDKDNEDVSSQPPRVLTPESAPGKGTDAVPLVRVRSLPRYSQHTRDERHVQWLGPKGREKMEKAKAKFSEIKQRIADGMESGIQSPRGRSLGVKLKDFLFVEEEGNIEQAVKGGQMGNTIAVERKKSFQQSSSNKPAGSEAPVKRGSSTRPPEDNASSAASNTSSAMKYVASLFRSTSISGTGKDFAEESSDPINRSRGRPPTRESAPYPTGTESRANSMLSKAYQSVRQQLDREL